MLTEISTQPHRTNPRVLVSEFTQGLVAAAWPPIPHEKNFTHTKLSATGRLLDVCQRFNLGNKTWEGVCTPVDRDNNAHG